MSEPTVVGLHLCGTVLRRAELHRVGARTEITTAELPLLADPQAAVSSNPVQAAPAEGETTRCIAAMPTSEVMSRCWTFPDADEGKLRRMVAHRVEADLPVPIDQLRWGYRKGAVRSWGDTRRQVFVQGVRSEQVGRHLAKLSAAGFPVDALTTEAEAISALYQHGLERHATEGSEVLVLVTSDDWLVAVFGNGLLHSLRRIPAEPNRLELTCRQCQQAIEGQVSRHEVRCVLWCAPVAQVQARGALAERLGIAVEPIESARHLVGAGGTRLSPEQLAAFGPAIGLALAGAYEPDRIIRLGGRERTEVEPRGQRFQRIAAHPWRWTAAAAALAIVAVAIQVGALGWETRKMRELVGELASADSPLAALQPKIGAMQRLETYRIDVEGIVADLCRPIPDSIVISSIQLSRGRRLVFKGTSKDPKAIFALADALRKSDRFAAVNPEGTEPARGGGFTISAELVGVNTLPSSGRRGGQWR